MTKNKKKLAKFERNNKEIMRNINHIYIYIYIYIYFVPKKRKPKRNQTKYRKH